MTIYQATETGPAVCAMGDNRAYAIGDIAYRFKRQTPGTTIPNFAAGYPVMLVDGQWLPFPTNRIIRNWTDTVTVLNLET